MKQEIEIPLVRCGHCGDKGELTDTRLVKTHTWGNQVWCSRCMWPKIDDFNNGYEGKQVIACDRCGRFVPVGGEYFLEDLKITVCGDCAGELEVSCCQNCRKWYLESNLIDYFGKGRGEDFYCVDCFNGFEEE